MNATVVFIKKNFFTLTVGILLVLTILASYTRFMVTYDYLVTYEASCDPYAESCFVYCEDEQCSEPFYYALITRPAYTINEQCTGDVVVECAIADQCLENEPECNLTYCSRETDEDCDTLIERDRPTNS